MLPRLISEESMLMAERVAVGSGSLKPGAAKRVVNRWYRQSRPAGVKSKPAPRALLAGMGIKVREVPRRAEARVDE